MTEVVLLVGCIAFYPCLCLGGCALDALLDNHGKIKAALVIAKTPKERALVWVRALKAAVDNGNYVGSWD